MITQLTNQKFKFIYDYLKKSQTWLLPYTCVLCGSQSQRSVDLCQACEQDLPWSHNACLQCGISLTTTTQQDYQVRCGECLKSPPPYISTFALCHYEQPIARLITQLKFNGKLIYATILGELMGVQIANQLQYNKEQVNSMPECIIPVPLHKKRLRYRGYNQALEIAKPIAKYLQIPLNIKDCERTKETQEQSEIPAEQRQRNVRNAFKVNHTVQAKHVAIVDDVMTTGSTVTELANALQKVGVERIHVWCCARTSLKT